MRDFLKAVARMRSFPPPAFVRPVVWLPRRTGCAPPPARLERSPSAGGFLGFPKDLFTQLWKLLSVCAGKTGRCGCLWKADGREGTAGGNSLREKSRSDLRPASCCASRDGALTLPGVFAGSPVRGACAEGALGSKRLCHGPAICSVGRGTAAERRSPISPAPALPYPSLSLFLLLFMTPLLKKPQPQIASMGHLPRSGNLTSPLLLVQLRWDGGGSRGGLPLSQTRADP